MVFMTHKWTDNVRGGKTSGGSVGWVTSLGGSILFLYLSLNGPG